MGERTAAYLFLGLGAAVAGVTAAVEAGLVTGVRAAWPALVVAGVLIVVGLVNLRRPHEPEAVVAKESGPIAESGRDPHEAEPPLGQLRRLGTAGPDFDPPRDGGGGEPDGRD